MERIIFIISLPFMLMGWALGPDLIQNGETETEAVEWVIEEAKKIER